MIYNLGSINADYMYRVPHLPAPGETLAAHDMLRGLGGKGANQSVAAALAGSQVCHIGAIGRDGDWVIDALRGYGVDCTYVSMIDAPTAHAIINVDSEGENSIIIYPGANAKQSLTRVKTALDMADPGDFLLLQNETSHQIEAARYAHEKGIRVVYSAAPFSADAVQAVMPFIDLLVMNAIEANQLISALGVSLSQLPVQRLLITKGAAGADWYEDGQTIHVPAFAVEPVDTTGAGDCFAGYVIAGLDQGMLPEQAMRLATAAAALQVQTRGTADAIPARDTVDAFLT